MKRNKNVLGIDVGSTSLSLAELAPEGEILQASYLFHNGNAADRLLEALEGYELTRIGAIAATSSTPPLLRHATVCDNRVAAIAAAKHFHPSPGAVLIVGGEKFGLVLFDDQGEYLNYRSNTSCAAGTGSFLDQQAQRLNLRGIESFSEIAFRNRGEIPKIASRCAVFAKTDLIHVQQEGYSLEEICDGLCFGLAKNIVDTLFTGTAIRGPVVFVGGVSRNRAVVKHLARMTGAEMTVDPRGHLYGAIGAALDILYEGEETALPVNSPDELLLRANRKKTYHYPPLELRLSEYPDFDSEAYLFHSRLFPQATAVEVEIYEPLPPGRLDGVYLGIDIGSTSTKAIVMDRDRRPLTGLYTRTAGRPLEAVKVLFEALDRMARERLITFSFAGAGTTGSGRKFIGQIIGADLVLDEITAHARAAFELDPQVDTIIEIGGQDAKFTTLSNGMVTFSIMNTVCAAGTGSFIEEQAGKLGVSLSDIAARTAGVRAPLSSDRCTVFMERDINHYLSEGVGVDEVLASVLHSVRENYLSKVAIEKNIGDNIFFQGATARNRSLVAAFEQRLGKPIKVSRYCHLTGALGVALLLRDEMRPKSTFRGVDLYRQEIPVRSEVCELCTNHCKLKIAAVNGETVAFGFLCGRDYETKKHVKAGAAFDLLGLRREIFRGEEPGPVRDGVTIGIPAALHLYDELPLWRKFFDLLGLRTVTSEPCRDAVKVGKQLTGAEFCAPITALHGHIRHLADKVDYIFLPVHLEVKNRNGRGRRQYCYYTQYAPAVVSWCEGLQSRARIMNPLLYSLKGTFPARVQLFKMLREMGLKDITFLQVSSAFSRAQDHHRSCLGKLREIYRKETERTEDISVVFLGRPYTILSRTMNNHIPDIFAKQGIRTFFQDMVPYDQEDVKSIHPLLDAFHWIYASKILECAEIIAKTEGVYPVMVTSFKCGPDSFAVEYFKEIMDHYKKPYLILQLDEHDSSVGYETRIEAGIRSFRNDFGARRRKNASRYLAVNPDVTLDKGILRKRTVLMPNWDDLSCRFLVGVLRNEGIDALLLEETQESIRRSMRYNSGQCIPLNAIVQAAIETIETHDLDPGRTVLWSVEGHIACNLRMFPYYMKKILEAHGGGMERVSVFRGNATFFDLSIHAAANAYYAHMFGGYLRQVACKLRPYEVRPGETDRAVARASDILYETFLLGRSKEEALQRIAGLFDRIRIEKTPRPKVAIFGDMYARYNDNMNQHLIRTIERHGGEVIATPYSELMKMAADPYISRWITEGEYGSVLIATLLKSTVPVFERRYYKYFSSMMREDVPREALDYRQALETMDVKYLNTGESMENILKIFALIRHYPDLSLFVQTNPAFCCPSLVTQSMAGRIETLTGIPIVTIEYDGTGAFKNDDIVPYLKFPRSTRRVHRKKAQ